MKITDLSDGEILLKLGDLEKEYDIRLTFANKLFYISLLHLCEEIGDFDEVTKEYYVELSIDEFGREFSISPTTALQSLNLLTKCKVIRREEQKKEFRKLGNGKYITNSAYRTYLDALYLTVI